MTRGRIQARLGLSILIRGEVPPARMDLKKGGKRGFTV
jgi:hypothetical protein